MPQMPLEELLTACITILTPTPPAPVVPSPLSSITFSDLVPILSETIGEVASLMTLEKADGPSSLNAVSQKCAVAYLERLNAWISQNPASANRPIILLFPIRIEQLSSRDPGSPWICCVVLPDNYKAPYGPATGNVGSKVMFYMDSRFSNHPGEMPANFLTFYQLLNKGCTRNISNGDLKQTVITPPAFPECAFYNGSGQRCQLNASDNLSWAIYHAWMLILTGSADFAVTAELSSQLALLRLRQLMTQVRTTLASSVALRSQPDTPTPVVPSSPNDFFRSDDVAPDTAPDTENNLSAPKRH